MKTRCKFYVSEVTQHGYPGATGQPETVKLQAVMGGLSAEDESFAAATPSGELKIAVSNPAVIGTFKPGAEYYIDLIPVE